MGSFCGCRQVGSCLPTRAPLWEEPLSFRPTLLATLVRPGTVPNVALVTVRLMDQSVLRASLALFRRSAFGVDPSRMIFVTNDVAHIFRPIGLAPHTRTYR